MLQEMVQRIRSLPVVKQMRKSRWKRNFFDAPDGSWGLYGGFTSISEARKAIPKSSTYDDDRLVDMNVDYFSRVHLFDYPLLFWLSKLISQASAKRVVDFGGHVGVKFYAFRDYLTLPEDFDWHVVDVETMVRRGREKAAAAGETRLSFSTDLASAPPSRVLICSGSLSYVEDNLADLVKRCVLRPAFVITNKVSVLDGKEIVTLEGFGASIIPYRMLDGRTLNASMQGLGYQLVDHWEIPDRKFSIPHVAEAQAVVNIGQVWQSP